MSEFDEGQVQAVLEELKKRETTSEAEVYGCDGTIVAGIEVGILLANEVWNRICEEQAVLDSLWVENPTDEETNPHALAYINQFPDD